MMFLVGLLIVFFSGYFLLQLLSDEWNPLVIIGSAFLVGLGLAVVVMVFYAFLRINISYFSVNGFLAVVAVGLFVYLKSTKREFGIQLKQMHRVRFSFAWFFIMGLIMFLLYAIISKNMYWPNAEYDALTGFDLQAKMIAKEGTMKTSIYLYPSESDYYISRFFYPPFTAAVFSLAYMADYQNSKLMIVFIYLSFLLVFYALCRESLHDTWALLVVFMVIITPEMFSHASLALTNLPNAVYSSLSILFLWYWLSNRKNSYFILSLLLMVFTQLCRSDSICFGLVAVFILLIDSIKTKKYWYATAYFVFTLVPFIAWTLYVKYYVGADNSSFFIKELFFDSNKLSQVFSKCLTIILGDGMYYGISFYVFVFVLALNTVEVVSQKHLLAIYIVASWLFYTLLYYQIDYNFAGSMDSYINASYKRGMFSFIPLMWFFIGTSPRSNLLIQKLNIFFRLK